MSVATGAGISSSGLILNFDPSNIRCFGAKSTSKITAGIGASFSNWAGLTGSSSNYTSAEGKSGVYLNTINGGGVNWWNPTNGQFAASASTRYVVTAKVRFTGGTPSANLFYIRQYNSGGSQLTEYGIFSGAQLIPAGGDSYYAYAYFTSETTTASILFHGYEYSGGMNIWLEDVQCRQAGMTSMTEIESEVVMNGSPSYTTLGGATCFRLTATGQSFTGTLYGTQPTTDVTIETWVYPEAEVQGDDRGCMFRLGGASALYHSWNKSNQKLSNYWYSHPTEGYHETGAAVNRNTWSCFTSVWNYTAGVLWQYTNNVKTQTGSAVGNAAPGNGIQIGQEGSSRQFAGGIGLVRVWGRALSEAEVNQNFNASRRRFGL